MTERHPNIILAREDHPKVTFGEPELFTFKDVNFTIVHVRAKQSRRARLVGFELTCQGALIWEGFDTVPEAKEKARTLARQWEESGYIGLVLQAQADRRLAATLVEA